VSPERIVNYLQLLKQILGAGPSPPNFHSPAISDELLELFVHVFCEDDFSSFAIVKQILSIGYVELDWTSR